MGYSALQAGLVLAPLSLLLALSPLFGRLAGRYGSRLFMTIGPLGVGAGLLLLTRLHPDAVYWTGLLPAIVVFGLGMANTVAPLHPRRPRRRHHHPQPGRGGRLTGGDMTTNFRIERIDSAGVSCRFAHLQIHKHCSPPHSVLY
jgi:MFS family permease